MHEDIFREADVTWRKLGLLRRCASLPSFYDDEHSAENCIDEAFGGCICMGRRSLAGYRSDGKFTSAHVHRQKCTGQTKEIPTRPMLFKCSAKLQSFSLTQSRQRLIARQEMPIGVKRSAACFRFLITLHASSDFLQRPHPVLNTNLVQCEAISFSMRAVGDSSMALSHRVAWPQAVQCLSAGWLKHCPSLCQKAAQSPG